MVVVKLNCSECGELLEFESEVDDILKLYIKPCKKCMKNEWKKGYNRGEDFEVYETY